MLGQILFLAGTAAFPIGICVSVALKVPVGSDEWHGRKGGE